MLKAERRASVALGGGTPRWRALLQAGILTAATLGAVSAYAEGEDPQSVSEVVVTGKQADLQPKVQSSASFIDVPVLDVPATISVVPESLIRDRGITSVDDVLRNVAGIQVSQGATGREPGEDATARGFPIAGSNTFRDGLRQSPYTYIPLEFYDRVEVLKGLTALQQGFIGPAGLIDFITKRPQPQSFVHSDLLVDTDGGSRATADVNLADVGRGVGLRVVGVYQDLSNYIHDFGGHRDGVQIAARLPLDSKTVLDFDYSHAESISDYQTPLYYFDGNPTGLPHVNPRTFLGQSYSGYPTRSTEASGRMTHVFDDRWKLVVAGSIQTFSRVFTQCGQAYLYDADPKTGDASYDPSCEPRNSSNRSGAILGAIDVPYNNAEARLTGGGKVLGVDNEIAIGYQYTYNRYIGSNPSFTYNEIDNLGAGFFTQNVFNPRQYAIPSLFQRVPNTSFNAYTVSVDQGVYAQDRLSFGRHWQLWLGGRYENYNDADYDRPVSSVGDGIAIVDSDNRVVSGDGSTTFGKPFKNLSATYVVHTFTPSAALVFKPWTNLSLYASYSQALEEGGVAPDTAENARQVFPPIRSETYEAGVKWDLGAATLTGAAFRIEQPLQVTNSQNVFTQSGTERHQGVEFSASGRLTSEVTVVAGLMLLDAKQLDVDDPTLEGKRPPGVADVVANAYVEYAPRWAPRLVLTVGDYHVGDQYLFGDDVFKVGGHDRVDFGARYSFSVHKTQLTARVNVQNVADSYYYTVPSGGGAVIVGDPRTVRFSISADI